MAEYIDREAAHDAVVDAIWHGKRSMYSVANAINSVPSADVAPVRHGRWLSWDELHGGNTLAKNVLGVFCSECIRQSDSKTHFCPNCGAYMK